MARKTVRRTGQDQDLEYAKTLQLSIGGKDVTTPRRALDLTPSTKSASRTVREPSVRGINEIYRRLTREKVMEIDSDVGELLRFGRKLRYAFEREEARDEVNFLFFEYSNGRPGSGQDTVPTDREIEYLCSIVSHPSSDVIVPPIMRGLSGEGHAEFLSKFLSRLKSFKKNPTVMGHLPFLPPRDIMRIGRMYMEMGISMFAVDFGNENPLDFYPVIVQINGLVETMDREFGMDGFLHGLNVPVARVRPAADVGEARDMMTFAMGMDSFGGNHRRRKMPPEVAERIKGRASAGRGPGTPNLRLFNGDDYGYYRLSDAGRVLEPDGMSVSADDLAGGGLSRGQTAELGRAFNAEGHAFEAKRFQENIRENSLRPYLEDKQYAAESLRHIVRRAGR